MTIDLYATQEALEKHARTLTQKRFNDILTDNQNKGNESSTYYGSPLMKRAIEPVATRIIETIEEAESGKAGKKSSAVKFLKLLDPNVIAFFTAKVVIDKITSKSNKLQTVANNIGKQLEDELRYTSFEEQHPWLFKKLLTEIDTTRLRKRQNLVAAYNRYCEEWTNWGDDAHLLLSVEQATLWLVMSVVTHQWELTTPLAQILLEAKGKRLGEASIFNEYMPTYKHHWEDAEFGLDDYKVGPRIPGEVAAPPLPKAAAQKRPPAAKPVHRQEDEREDPSDPFFFTDQPCDDDEDVPSASPLPKAPPAAEVTDYVQDDPYDDPILFADPPHDPPEAVFHEQQNSQPWTTTSKGQSMMYGRDYWRATLGI